MINYDKVMLRGIIAAKEAKADAWDHYDSLRKTSADTGEIEAARVLFNQKSEALRLAIASASPLLSFG